MRLRAFAPAKINLFLHVAPPRDDGKHPLAGLSVFADVGDVLTLDTDGPPGLRVVGPLAAGVPTGSENLVLRALRAFGAETGVETASLALTLDKRLPAASGIGGGTSDAGAALRLAGAAFAPDLPDAVLVQIARDLGADGPMCLFPRVAWTQGLGERLTPEPRLPDLHVVLVNPGVPVSTGAVFAAYDRDPSGDARLPGPPPDWSRPAVLDWLAAQRNDLQSVACRLTPEVTEALTALRADPDVRLVRMSGSGATVFGLVEGPEAARAIAERLAQARPDWWIAPAELGDRMGDAAPTVAV